MDNFILLTSEDFVRDNTAISDNISNKYLLPAIREAQEYSLQAILGSKLYHKIQDLIDEGTIDQTENIWYKDLLDMVQYYLTYEAMCKLCVILSVKFNNFGLNQTSDDNIQSLSIKDIFSMEQYYKDKADFYGKRIQDFLLSNHAHYPELTNNDVKNMNSNLYSNSTTGLWLGGKRGRGNGKDPRHLYYDKK